MERVSGGRVRLTPDRHAELIRIDAAVNATKVQKGDQASGFPADRWEIGTPIGDCEDFALTKKQRLIEAGWPSDVLLLAIVARPQGDVHAVLIARTADEDLVLDNLRSEILPWEKTGYRGIAIQSRGGLKEWRRFN